MARARTRSSTPASTPSSTRPDVGIDATIGNGSDWPAQTTIDSPDAISLLADGRALRHLAPFQLGEQTLTSAARTLGVATSTMAHWIPRFVRSGLVVHLGDRPRAGAASPVYRAVGRELLVKYRDIPVDARVALLDEARYVLLRLFLDGVDEQMAADEQFTLGFAPYADGGTMIRPIESAAAAAQRPMHDGWRTLRLTEDEARRLASELDAVVGRFASNPAGHTHVVHTGVAPAPRVRWRSASDQRR